MTDKPPIPRAIFERIVKFLGTGATGQVTLHVHQGRIQSVAISDHFRVEDDPIVPIDIPRPPVLKTR